MENLSQLRRLYEASDSVRRIIELMGQRSKGRVLEVDVIRKKAALPRQDVVSTFKRFETLGLGRFVVGRRGATSRFEASSGLAEIAAVARGESAALPDFEEEVAETLPTAVGAVVSPEETLSHVLVLRGSPLIKIQIPFDITTDEVERLVGFLKSLPSRQ